MMHRIKVLLSTLLLTGMVFAGATGSVTAAFDPFGNQCKDHPEATVCQESGQTQTQQDNRIYGPNGVISKIANILSIVIGFAAIIVLIVAGIQYMVSTGDPTKVNNAKNAIIYALVGLAIAVIARAVVVFVINKL